MVDSIIEILIIIKNWMIENIEYKDLIIPSLSLIGAVIGSWWSNRRRIGIEVLSKNRHEWLNKLRGGVTELVTDCFYLSDLFYEMILLHEMKLKKEELDIKKKELSIQLLELKNKINSEIIFLELILSPKRSNNMIVCILNNVLLNFPIFFKKKKLAIKSNLVMIRMSNSLRLLRIRKLVDLVHKHQSIILLNSPAEPINNEDQTKSLYKIRKEFEKFTNRIYGQAQNLISIEWQRIKKTI